MDMTTDIYEVYRQTIIRLGRGIYFFYDNDTGSSYSFDIRPESLAGQKARLFIEEDSSRIYIDSPDFVGYIKGLNLVGVVQMGIPYFKPNYVPLNFS
jgi:hypothetical protein